MNTIIMQQPPPEAAPADWNHTPQTPQVKCGGGSASATTNQFDHRFQRTDQWMPVYSWLESLNADEVVKSKEISDWLTANQQILEHLSSRHSRYHLMHYIKKCHVKILKRQGKIQVADKASSVKVGKSSETKAIVPFQYFGGNNLSSIPKDSELYKAKQREAVQKYEILVEFEKQLLTLFTQPVQN